MERRDLSHKEKLYLREQNVITETQCTLGKKHNSDKLRPAKILSSRKKKEKRNIFYPLYICCVNTVCLYESSSCVLLLKNAECVCTVFPGLTALRSDEVIDLMIKEYPSKHSEYSVILQERERQRIAKEYSVRIQK